MTARSTGFDPPPEPAPVPSGLLGALGATGRALRGHPVAVLHARPGMRRKIRRGEIAFFNRLIQVLQGLGYSVAVAGLYRPPWLAWLSSRAIHFYRGPNRVWRRPRVFSIGSGYLRGYWSIDPKGYRDKSSIGARPFDLAEIPHAEMAALNRRLKRRMVQSGASSRPQAKRGAVLPQGSIALMLQLRTLFEYRIGQVCSDAEMVRAVVAARGTRPVVIKYHPFGATRAVRRAVEAVLDPENGVHLTDANVHDVLEAADLAVTQTSGAGFEALLHKTKVLLFADTDYAAGATKLRALEDLPQALEQALAKKVYFANFVFWYLERNLFHQDSADFEQRLLAEIEANGAAATRRQLPNSW